MTWKERNKERIAAYRKAYWEQNRIKELERNKIWWSNNPKARKAHNRKYLQNHGDKINAKRRSSEFKAKRNKRERVRYQTDERYNIEKRLRASFLQSLKAKGVSKKESVLKYLGCSIQDFKVHIEIQFKDGMNWENRNLWHIDHIRPVASFDLTDEADVRQCWHHKNFQPLWAKDNQSKGSKFS